MKIGDKLKKLRTSRHMTQQSLAKELGISPTSVHKLESDATSPSVETLVSVADVFGVSLDWLANLKPQASAPPSRVRFLIYMDACAPLAPGEWAETLRALSDADCLVIASPYGTGEGAKKYRERAILDSDYYVLLAAGDESGVVLSDDAEENLTYAAGARVPCMVVALDGAGENDGKYKKSVRALRNVAHVRSAHGTRLPETLLRGIVAMRREAGAAAGWLPMAEKIREDASHAKLIEILDTFETVKKMIALFDTRSSACSACEKKLS